MSDENARECLKELRLIRYALYLIVLALFLIGAQLGLHFHAQTLGPPRSSAPEMRRTLGTSCGSRAPEIEAARLGEAAMRRHPWGPSGT
jgi:hypothetical protein